MSGCLVDEGDNGDIFFTRCALVWEFLEMVVVTEKIKVQRRRPSILSRERIRGPTE